MSQENNIIIEVVNQSDVEMTGIELEWHVEGKTVGGQGVVNADGSLLKKGESFLFELLESDLPTGTDIELAFAVTQAEGSRRVLEPSFPLQAEYGRIYRYTLTGTQAEDLWVVALDNEESTRDE